MPVAAERRRRYQRQPAGLCHEPRQRAGARDVVRGARAKVFDNLYFVGGKVHSAWALTTSEGIILIDTIFPYNSEELIVGGMQKLGLDPKNIKYVLISHAHADHIGGAEMLQTRYGARIVMGGPDWDPVAKYPNRYKTMAPKRDIVATDGMKITLGGTTVTIWLTPGHTPGTLSYTFTVLDQRPAGQRGLLGRHGIQLREQHTGSGHQEFPDLYRVAAAHGRAGCRHGRPSSSRTIRSSTMPSTRTECSPGAVTVPTRTSSGPNGSSAISR